MENGTALRVSTRVHPRLYYTGRPEVDPVAQASAARFKSAKARLVSVIRKLHHKYVGKLDEEKRRGALLWKKPDFIWESLLVSMATMGNSRGEALVKRKDLHRRVAFAALSALSSAGRIRVLEETMRKAGVRWHRKKARWLGDNFSRLVADGGPETAKQKLESCQGREGAIRFLQSFRGIGEKYARDLMMNVYDPRFRESVAFDVRLNKVLEALSVKFSSYRKAEEFFLEVAHRAGLEGWEFDRLVYKGIKNVLDKLGCEAPARKPSGAIQKEGHKRPCRRVSSGSA
jgi:thermostable 8-oxoguanine DNA glycosylase